MSLVVTTSVSAKSLDSKGKDVSNGSLLTKSTSIKIDDNLRDYLKSMKEKQGKDVQVLSSAPPLSYLEVYAACSSQHPDWEYFSQSQYTSVADHGGAEMYIVTVELGYGFQQQAKMNGNGLVEYNTQAIDLDNDSIIDGYFHYWNASSYNSGQFTSQNTSVNYPYNTMSDWINIR